MTPFDDRMALLRARFVERACAARVRLDALLAAPDRDALKDLCHGLAGSAGVFGQPALGEAARLVEEAIDDRGEDREVERLVSRLSEELDAVVQDAG